jgi:hypothetical protein
MVRESTKGRGGTEHGAAQRDHEILHSARKLASDRMDDHSARYRKEHCFHEPDQEFDLHQ